jgi:hypothetical protein
LAKENLAGRSVVFEHAASMTNEPADFMISLLVFQHIRPTQGLQIIGELARRLRGIGIIDVPVYYTGGRVRATMRTCRHLLKSLLPVGRPLIPMFTYEIEAVRDVLERSGCFVHVATFDTWLFRKATVIFRRQFGQGSASLS